MNSFDSDMSNSTNTEVYFDWKTVIYIYVCGRCRKQFYAAKFEQTITHQHILLRREGQSTIYFNDGKVSLIEGASVTIILCLHVA